MTFEEFNQAYIDLGSPSIVLTLEEIFDSIDSDGDGISLEDHISALEAEPTTPFVIATTKTTEGTTETTGGTTETTEGATETTVVTTTEEPTTTVLTTTVVTTTEEPTTTVQTNTDLTSTVQTTTVQTTTEQTTTDAGGDCTIDDFEADDKGNCFLVVKTKLTWAKVNI